MADDSLGSILMLAGVGYLVYQFFQSQTSASAAASTSGMPTGAPGVLSLSPSTPTPLSPTAGTGGGNPGGISLSQPSQIQPVGGGSGWTVMNSAPFTGTIPQAQPSSSASWGTPAPVVIGNDPAALARMEASSNAATQASGATGEWWWGQNGHPAQPTGDCTPEPFRPCPFVNPFANVPLFGGHS